VRETAKTGIQMGILKKKSIAISKKFKVQAFCSAYTSFLSDKLE
jgi:hypothetical protein